MHFCNFLCTRQLICILWGHAHFPTFHPARLNKHARRPPRSNRGAAVFMTCTLWRRAMPHAELPLCPGTANKSKPSATREVSSIAAAALRNQRHWFQGSGAVFSERCLGPEASSSPEPLISSPSEDGTASVKAAPIAFIELTQNMFVCSDVKLQHHPSADMMIACKRLRGNNQIQHRIMSSGLKNPLTSVTFNLTFEPAVIFEEVNFFCRPHGETCWGSEAVCPVSVTLKVRLTFKSTTLTRLTEGVTIKAWRFKLYVDRQSNPWEHFKWCMFQTIYYKSHL